MTEARQLADQSARDRIMADLDCNLLVEAGAGSGKTHEMAQRMAAGIATGTYQVAHMSAVTFTRKAAAELRGRFQLALEKELARSAGLGDAADRVARIRGALSNLERFFAGTIHSFCAHLLRERPVEAGVSPGFTELDEVADALLRKESWRDFLTATKADPMVAELREAGVKPKDLDGAFETVCLYEEVDFPPGDGARPDTAAGREALGAFWAAISAQLPQPISTATTCDTQKAALRFRAHERMGKLQSTRPAVLAELLATWNFQPSIVQKWWSHDPATKKRLSREITALHGEFRTSVVEPFLAEWRRYIYTLSVTLLMKARAHAAEERRRGNTLNYGDLLQLAARVLRGNAEVRRALQARYRWLFVDEFQDTDPVQAEIIFLLAGDDAALPVAEPPFPLPTSAVPAVVDWRSIPLRPGALFVVGDPKQSIYRFRRADIDIYNHVRDRLSDPRSGQVVSLTTNFRSVPGLCEWANRVFAQRFPAEPTPYSPKFAPLDANRAANAGPGKALYNEGKAGLSGVRTLTVPAATEKGDVPAAEAERIARFIRSEVDAGRRRFGDFLVLTRKRKTLGAYAEALEALQVPVEVSGAGAFGESEEVAQLALLLRALSDPQDGVSLVGVLRGPLFGVSDQELFAFREGGGWFSIDRRSESDWGRVTLQPDVSSGATRVSEALGSLKQMFHWTRVLPAGAALERILEHTGYLALAATTTGGVEAGDLLHAIDRVRQVVEGGQSLASAAAALEADREASSEVESLPLEPGQGDVVRVMNLHKAKGLEAAVVFLADPCGGPKPRRARARIVRDGLVSRGYFSITTPSGRGEKVLAEPAGWDQLEQEEQTYLAAEEQRLLYVAATRAKDLLVVGRWGKSGAGTLRPWEAFAPFLEGVAELPAPAEVSAPGPQPADLSATANAQASAMRNAAHARACVPSWSATSVTAEARYIAKIARSVDGDADDPTRVVVGDTPSHRADAGMAWGTLIHGLLEHAMRHQKATRDDLRRLAMWLTMEDQQLRPVIEEALETVEAVARADFWEKAKASEHQEEVPFCVGAVGPDGKMELTSGVVDLVHRVDGYWNVVDYKTDRSSVAAAEKYEAQLRAYREIWEKVTGEEVSAELVSARVSPPKA